MGEGMFKRTTNVVRITRTDRPLSVPQQCILEIQLGGSLNIDNIGVHPEENLECLATDIRRRMRKFHALAILIEVNAGFCIPAVLDAIRASNVTVFMLNWLDEDSLELFTIQTSG